MTVNFRGCCHPRPLLSGAPPPPGDGCLPLSGGLVPLSDGNPFPVTQGERVCSPDCTGTEEADAEAVPKGQEQRLQLDNPILTCKLHVSPSLVDQRCRW